MPKNVYTLELLSNREDFLNAKPGESFLFEIKHALISSCRVRLVLNSLPEIIGRNEWAVEVQTRIEDILVVQPGHFELRFIELKDQFVCCEVPDEFFSRPFV